MKFEEISSLRQDIKDTPSDLRQFLAPEPFLKMMKNTYFTSKDLFVPKIFVFTYWSCRKTTWLER